ncbi:MAG: hypothetical protein AAFY88_26725 [Acidobacteriota bacterium]
MMKTHELMTETAVVAHSAPPDHPRAHRAGIRRWRIAAAAMAAFLIAVIASADLGQPLPIIDWVRYLPGGDFTGHIVLVGAMAFFAGGCAPRTIGGVISTGAAVVAVVILGEELSQLWIASRSFSIGDLAANGLGIAGAELLRRGVGGYRERRLSRRALVV